MEKREQITITTEENEEIKLNIELTFDDEASGKAYAVFSDIEDDEYISIAVIEDDEHLSFLDPENKNESEEYEYVFKIFAEFIENNDVEEEK